MPCDLTQLIQQIKRYRKKKISDTINGENGQNQ